MSRRDCRKNNDSMLSPIFWNLNRNIINMMSVFLSMNYNSDRLSVRVCWIRLGLVKLWLGLAESRTDNYSVLCKFHDDCI